MNTGERRERDTDAKEIMKGRTRIWDKDKK
jgi:hypothetical protein